MTLVVRGYLKEAYVQTAYRTNIYLTTGPKAYAVTRLTKADIENERGERIHMGVLKQVKTKKKARKSGASSKDVPSSSKAATVGRGAKRKQIEMDGEDEEEDDEDEDDGVIAEDAMDVDDDEDFMVDNSCAGPSARTLRPLRNRRPSGRPVTGSDVEDIVDDAEAQETPRTSRARRKENTDKRRPIGFDFEGPSDEEVEYMSGEEGWSFDMKGTGHRSKGRTLGGGSKKANRSLAGQSDVIEISSD